MNVERPRLAAHSLVYLAANVLSAAMPLLLLPLLTRHLQVADYGRVAMFQMLVAAVSALAGLSVHAAAARKLYDADVAPRGLAQFVGSCLMLLALTSTAMLVLIAIAHQSLEGLTGLPPRFLALSVLCSAAGIASNLALAQWQLRLQPLAYGTFQVAGAVLVAVVTALLVVGTGAGASGPILGQVVGVCVPALFALGWLRRAGLLDFSWRPDLVREALAFGVPLIPHIVGLFLLGTMDRAVIGRFLGLDEVGIYVVAAQLALAMKLVFDAFNKAYVPWLYERLQRREPPELSAVVRLTWGYFAIALGGGGIAFLIGPFAIGCLAGEAYARSGELVGWLGLAQAFYGMYLMVTNYLFFARRTALLSAVTVSCGLVAVALMVAGARDGLTGVAMALAGAGALRFLLTWAAAQRSVPMPWFTALRAAPPA